ncbi:TIGR04282 family arsenosugar biosynthesis glycosyltransferase [soil metagenome]
MAEAGTRPVTGALAIWVKTPGLSPVKTRLAASIGTNAAEEFYRLSAQAVAAVVRQAVGTSAELLAPYWAVAEEAALAHPDWRAFPTVYQGEGDLGARLSHVYDTLLQRHSWVIFIGADAPQITSELLAEAAQVLNETGDFVIGPAEDGGYYLFGGSTPLPCTLWIAVPYSAGDTLEAFAELLRSFGSIRYLPRMFDVDTVDELMRLTRELAEWQSLLPEQTNLLSVLGGLNYRTHRETRPLRPH